MKRFLQLLVYLLFSFQVVAQYSAVTHGTGTVLYGSTNVGVTGSGVFALYSTGWCGAVPYHIGSTGSWGAYTFTFSPTVNGVRIQITASDAGESFSFRVNGVRYPLTAANLTAWASDCATPTMSIVGDSLVSSAANSHAQIDIIDCNMNSVRVFTAGFSGSAGSIFSFLFTDTVDCSSEVVNNGPLCLGDSLRLFPSGSTTDSYSWTGPNGFTSTRQLPVRYLESYDDSGTYSVVINGTVVGTSHVVIKPKPIVFASSNSPVCYGSDIFLTSWPDSTGETFSWTGPGGFTSAIQNPTNAGATEADSGTYTVIADWNGCKDTATTYVSLIRVPIPEGTNNSPVCSGSPFGLFATDTLTSGISWSWSGPGGYTSAVQNPVVSGTTTANSGVYTVRATFGSCFSTDTTLVTIIPTPPVPEIVPIPPICSGLTLNLSVSDTPGATFQWFGPLGFNSTLQYPTIANIPTSATGTYTVIAIYNGCVSAPDYVYVLVDTTPEVPSVSSSTPVCSGDTLFFTSDCNTPLVTYSWAGPASYASTNQNPYIANTETYMSGNYTVTATRGSCRNSAVTTVVVNQTPSIPVMSSNSPVCSGNLLILGAYATPTTGTYYWNGPMGFTTNIQNPTISGAVVGASGVYSAYEILNGCISPTGTISVTVFPTPAVPTAFSNTPVCEGDTLFLFGSNTTAGVSYSWAGPAGYAASMQNPMLTGVLPVNAGIYTVTSTVSICSSSNTTLVNVTASPTLTVSSNSPVCSGDTLKLFATSAIGNTFSWIGPYTYFSAGPSTSRFPAIMEYGGVYTVTTTESGGCTSRGTTTVVMNETPAPPWVTWLTYCQYYPAPPLHAVDARNVLWFPSAAIGGTGVSTAPVPPTDVPGVYFYYLNQTVSGCTSEIDSIQVIVNPKPVISVFPSYTEICPRDSVLMSATDPNALSIFRWYPSLYVVDSAVGITYIKPITTQQYSAVSTNQYGCTDTGYTQIRVFEGGVIDMNVEDSVTVFTGQSFHLQPRTNCVSLSWFPPESLNNAFISDPVATPLINTMYIAEGVTTNGCKVYDSVYIHVNQEVKYALPNAFTPGNGVNNEFKLIADGVAQLNFFRIFDRWGNIVFETKNISQGWDGTFNGKPMPFGVYVYDIQAVSSVSGKLFSKQGNITLVR